jgi:hypothetical protein
MKAIIQPPIHESYLKHRKQRLWQIILPVGFAAVICLGLVVFLNIAAFRNNADITQLAATSAIWIILPIIVMALVLFIILAGLVYLLMRLLRITPVYTGKAQDFAYKIARTARRGADAVAKPFITMDSWGASINRILGRK